MGNHARKAPRRLNLTRRDAMWAAAVGLAIMLGGGTAYALATPTYTDQCVRTVKANGGITLDCDPIAAAPTPSPTPTGTPAPSPSPSPTPTSSPTPTPTPTTTSPTPTPSPTSGPVTGCLAHPGACGYPDASSAGAHGTLAAYTGPTTISAAGTVIHDVAITGCLVITGQNVVLRNVRIDCNNRQAYVVETAGAADTGGTTTIDHVTVVCGAGMHGGTAFGDERMTAVGVDISHCENGFDANGSFTVTDSYIHDMFKGDSVAPAPHTDGIQVWPATSTSGPIVWRHNTVLMHDDNAAFTSGSPNDPTFGHGIQSNLTIDNNLLDGGSYTVYCSGNKGAITNNRFGPLGPNHSAPWEHADSCGGLAQSGNIEDTTGLPALIQ